MNNFRCSEIWISYGQLWYEPELSILHKLHFILREVIAYGKIVTKTGKDSG